MTQDEIIEMVMQIGGCDRPENDSPALKMFVAFANLVAAKEREACAKVCDELSDKHTWEGCYANECAETIRAKVK